MKLKLGTFLWLAVIASISIHVNILIAFHGNDKDLSTESPSKKDEILLVPIPVPIPVSIPRRLIFTYRSDLLKSKFPAHLHENVRNTIQAYANAWNTTPADVDVHFLTDVKCAEYIEKVEPRLLKPFSTERNGPYKGDICRIAALYELGGYYFDVDIQVVKALDPDPNVTFITSHMGNKQFFQAILALSPNHPVAKSTLNSMVHDWYLNPTVMAKFNLTSFEIRTFQSAAYTKERENYLVEQYGYDPDNEIGLLLGPATLWLGYNQHINRTGAWLLSEVNNEKEQLYPEWIREATSWGCNYMVHDNGTPYFYSRCKGTWLCPNARRVGET